MINISAKYANLLKNDEVPKELVIHFPNNEYRDLTNSDIVAESMKFVESAGDTDTIKFGISDTPCFEVDVYGVPDLSNSDIEVKLICDFSEYGGDDDFEIIIGRFKIDKMTQNYNTELVHILAYSSAMIDLDAEDITSDFFYGQYKSLWRGSIERFLNRFTDGWLSDTFTISDEFTLEKELVSDIKSATYKSNKDEYDVSTGQYVFYWMKTECTHRCCDYFITVPDSDGTKYYYRYVEQWQTEDTTGGYSGIFGDDQKSADYRSITQNLSDKYPRTSATYQGRYWSNVYDGTFSYASDIPNGGMLDQYEILKLATNVQRYQFARASHCLSMKISIGTARSYTQTPVEPSSWTVLGDFTYPEIPISDFHDVKFRYLIQHINILDGIPLDLGYSVYESSAYRNKAIVNYSTPTSTGFTKRVLWNMIAECLGKMCRVNRNDGNIELYSLIDADGLYPSNDIYPAQDIYPRESNSYDIKLSMYEYLNYQGERSKKIGKVTVGTNGQYSAQVPDYNSNKYADIVISPDNIFTKMLEPTTTTVNDDLKTIADTILENYKNYEFIPYECQAVGLPFMQAGDFIVVENLEHDNKKFYIARRTLSGIQALKDDYSAGGLS